jgi:hypothetical protein
MIPFAAPEDVTCGTGDDCPHDNRAAGQAHQETHDPVFIGSLDHPARQGEKCEHANQVKI